MSKIIHTRAGAGMSPFVDGRLFPEWFAMCTTSQDEKKVVEHLVIRQIESFLPSQLARKAVEARWAKEKEKKEGA